jgi:hypothetical protein
MAALRYEPRRILIWAKTYPELSTKHLESVCTGGVTEDGSPIRLYPIDHRYLYDNQKFRKYQWITARVARDPSDPRPESHKIDCESMEVGEFVASDKHGWSARASIVFQKPSWQFESVDALLAAQKTSQTSIGVVTPREIVKVDLYERPKQEKVHFEEKKQKVQRIAKARRAQRVMFDEPPTSGMKRLDFQDKRVRIEWRCNAANCSGHTMQVLDWEAGELLRRHGEEKTLKKVADICDLSKHALRFFLGNIRKYPTSFSIGGLWYPTRGPKSLFD